MNNCLDKDPNLECCTNAQEDSTSVNSENKQFIQLSIKSFFAPKTPSNPSTLSLQPNTSPACCNRSSVTFAVDHFCRLPSPPKTNRQRKKRRLLDDNDNQTVIDAGQRQIGTVVCNDCGMVYTPQHLFDFENHEKFHNRLSSILSFSKSSSLIKNFKDAEVATFKDSFLYGNAEDGCIFRISSRSPSSIRRKAEEILEIVDAELGCPQLELASLWSSGKQAFLFVCSRKPRQFCGVCLVEEVAEAFGFGEDGFCCDTSKPVQLGVSRIWVLNSLRRKKIAERLIETSRLNFYLGCPIPLEQVAFSHPTQDGKELAKAVFGTSQFLVYKPI